MAEQKNDQTNTINVPADVLKSLFAEIANLRKENSETKKLLTSVQAKFDTILESISLLPACGAFAVFPDLPIELRNRIWDTALSIPRIVGAKLVVRDRNEEKKTLTPTAPNSSLLFVNKESRARAKTILVCLTEKEDRAQYRVPLLYIHPKLDTLWLINYYAERAKNARISKVVFGGEKISKLAIPYKTWNDVLFEHCEDEVVDLVIRIQSKGIKEVTLVIGEDETAKCSDIAFIVPREMADWHVAPYWMENVQDWFGVDECAWSQSDIYANKIPAQARDEYMAHAGLTRYSPTNSRIENHNTMVLWKNGLWKPPIFRFKEATTRKELGKLNEGI